MSTSGVKSLQVQAALSLLDRLTPEEQTQVLKALQSNLQLNQYVIRITYHDNNDDNSIIVSKGSTPMDALLNSDVGRETLLQEFKYFRDAPSHHYISNERILALHKLVSSEEMARELSLLSADEIRADIELMKILKQILDLRESIDFEWITMADFGDTKVIDNCSNLSTDWSFPGSE